MHHGKQIVIAVAIVCAACTGSALAGQSEVDRFLKEYKESAEHIKDRLSREKGLCIVSMISKNNPKEILKHNYVFDYNGDNKKIEVSYRRSEGTETYVYCIAGNTGFQLHRSENATDFDVAGVEKNARLTLQLKSKVDRFLWAPYCVLGLPLTAYLNDPTFHLDSVEVVNANGKDCYEIKFWTGSGDSPNTWTILLDPAMNWAIQRASLSNGGSQRNKLMQLEVKYKTDSPDDLVPTEVNLTDTAGIQYRCNFKDVIFSETPSSEYSMEFYKLPDLTRGPSVGFVRYPWLIMIAIGGCLLAAALRKISRRLNPQGMHPFARKGMTLIELLVVIAIVGVLVALLMVAVQGAREAARRSQCSNNLRQIGLGLHSYMESHGSLPIGRSYWPVPSQSSRPSCDTIIEDRSFLVAILPYVEQANLYNSLNQDRSIFDIGNRTGLSVQLGLYVCPSDPDATVRLGISEGVLYYDGSSVVRTIAMASTSYVGIKGSTNSTPFPEPALNCRPASWKIGEANGCLTDTCAGPITPGSIADGLSNTIMATEHAVTLWRAFQSSESPDPIHQWLNGWWFSGDLGTSLVTNYYGVNSYKKSSLNLTQAWTASASSLHPGGVNGLMADGSVRFIKESIESQPLDRNGIQATVRPGVWQSLATRNGGEMVDQF